MSRCGAPQVGSTWRSPAKPGRAAPSWTQPVRRDKLCPAQASRSRWLKRGANTQAVRDRRDLPCRTVIAARPSANKLKLKAPGSGTLAAFTLTTWMLSMASTVPSGAPVPRTNKILSICIVGCIEPTVPKPGPRTGVVMSYWLTPPRDATRYTAAAFGPPKWPKSAPWYQKLPPSCLLSDRTALAPAVGSFSRLPEPERVPLRSAPLKATSSNPDSRPIVKAPGARASRLVSAACAGRPARLVPKNALTATS